MLPKKFVWLPLVIGLEIGLVTFYAITVMLNAGDPFHLVDVNGVRTLPSLLQATQLFLLGAVPLWMFITYRGSSVPPSRHLLLVTAIFFLFTSVDELFKLNFIFHQHQLWKSIYLALGLSIPILFYRDLGRLVRIYPKEMRLIGIGIIIFLVGGFGLEIFRRQVQEPYWYQLFGRWKFYQVDAIRTALEELGEMLGETLVLKGTVSLMQQRKVQLMSIEPPC
ncbi:MAG: hypothetical protein AB8B99_12740 [Phormidesmis sp.]